MCGRHRTIAETRGKLQRRIGKRIAEAKKREAIRVEHYYTMLELLANLEEVQKRRDGIRNASKKTKYPELKENVTEELATTKP